MSIKQAQLKIKIKSLAAEARIIRKEELKRKGKWSADASDLTAHRRYVLRPEARSAHIAYGLIRGREYYEMEPTHITEPDWNRVKSLVKKYGTRSDECRLVELLDNMLFEENLLAA